VALPGAYAPASIALRVTGALKLPLHDKAVVLEEDLKYIAKRYLEVLFFLIFEFLL
jgi:hypothetical protein